MGKVSAAPSPTAPPGSRLRACAGCARLWESRSAARPRAVAGFPGRLLLNPQRRARCGRPPPCAVYTPRTSRVWEPWAPPVVSVPPPAFARHSGRRSLTKSRLGGGEEERPQRLLPTLSTSPPTPHVKRNNLFILGFKNPSLLPVLRGRPAPPPPHPPRRDPAQSRRLHLPSTPSSSTSHIPPSPSLSVRGRGGGSGRRFVRLAAQLCPGGRPVGRGAAPRGPAPSAAAARAAFAPHSSCPRSSPSAKKRRTLF